MNDIEFGAFTSSSESQRVHSFPFDAASQFAPFRVRFECLCSVRCRCAYHMCKFFSKKGGAHAGEGRHAFGGPHHVAVLEHDGDGRDFHHDDESWSQPLTK